MAGIEAVPEFLEAELIGHNIQVQLDVPEGVLNSRLGVGVSCGQTFGDLLDRLYTIAVERQRGGVHMGVDPMFTQIEWDRELPQMQ